MIAIKSARELLLDLEHAAQRMVLVYSETIRDAAGDEEADAYLAAAAKAKSPTLPPRWLKIVDEAERADPLVGARLGQVLEQVNTLAAELAAHLSQKGNGHGETT